MSKWLSYLTILLTVLCALSVEGYRGRRQRCFPGKKVYDECRRLCVCGANNTLTECTRQRKEFTSMSNWERRRYIRAVKTASTDERYKEEYNTLITLHIRQFLRGIHEMNHFLTWHRWYILQYENLLRKVDCKVTVPYWDWSIASGEPWDTDTDGLWYSGSTGFGGDGDSTNGYCVSSGPFADGAWQLVPAANPSCQRRRFNGYPPDAVAVAELLDIDVANFTDFEFTLRVNFHDTVHCLIGGTMCSLDSSCAPEFFLHHGFIDKIWADWQKKSKKHKKVYYSGIKEPLPAILEAHPAVMPSEVLDNLALPGDIRVAYLDVNDTETADFVRRLRKLKRNQLEKIARPDFDATNEESLKLFHVNEKDVRRARREGKRFRPKLIKDRKKMRSRKAKRLGLEISDLDEAEKEDREDKENNGLLKTFLLNLNLK